MPDYGLGFAAYFTISTDRTPEQLAARIGDRELERVVRQAVKAFLADPGRSTGKNWTFKIRIGGRPHERRLTQLILPDTVWRDENNAINLDDA